MKWNIVGKTIEIYLTEPFSFSECLLFLNRSELEILHLIADGSLYKIVQIGEKNVLIRIKETQSSLIVDFPSNDFPWKNCRKVVQHVEEWLGLNNDIIGFYSMAKKDPLLRPLIEKYAGLRIIGIPDLFEALVWAVIGQQINLRFAYTLKKRLVERYGESLEFEGITYWTFPTLDKVVSLNIEDFKAMQFTSRKAETILEIAHAMKNGELSKDSLLLEDNAQNIYSKLTSIKGVGPWTAEYVMMKCFDIANAFPISDVGLHNALTNQMGLSQKPTLTDIKEMAEAWEGWKAYATFYLWRSLYDEAAL